MSHSHRPNLACLVGLLLVLLLATANAQAQAALTAAISKVNSARFPTVTSYVTVVDGTGRPVLGLNAGSLEVHEDGKPVQGLQVGTVVNEQEPLMVALIIDTSGSMGGKAIVDAKAAAVTFIQGLGGNEQAAVISFSERPALVQPFTDNKDDLTKAIASLDAVGNTAFNDALILAGQIVAKQPDGRRIAIVLSDGEDTASQSTMDDALPFLQKAGTPVFTIGLGEKVDRNTLEAVATGTGGVALYAPSSADLVATYRNVTDQLRNQYVVTFNSSFPADNKRHELVIRANANNTTAEAKGSFVAIGVAPEITVVSPKEGETVQGKVRVEVTAEVAGEIKKVEAVAAGTVVGSTNKEPFVFEWDTGRLAAGKAVLDVSVQDSLGNRGTKQVTVQVQPAPASPTPVPPTPTPAPKPIKPAGNSLNQLLLPGSLILAVMAVGLVVVRGRRQTGYKLPRVPQDTWPSKCPTHGVKLKRGQYCPLCTAEDEKIVARRLRQLAGKPEEPEDPEGDSA
ncbi:MAG: VWA domain-containing protein [Chloroflexota bacterium]